MKKVIALFFFVAMAVCLQAQDLTWDLKFLKGRERESVQVSRIIQMDTGEPFQFIITPGSNCYCYVILRDSNQKIDVRCNEFLTKEKTFGPWPLSGSGTEIFYVIMSLEGQSNLENLIVAYKNNPSSQQNADNLYKEVVRLQNLASVPGVSGSPIEPSGGVVIQGGSTGARGGDKEYINHFDGKNLYVRPISIRH
jgi:hypothetical protein